MLVVWIALDAADGIVVPPEDAHGRRGVPDVPHLHGLIH